MAKLISLGIPSTVKSTAIGDLGYSITVHPQQAPSSLQGVLPVNKGKGILWGWSFEVGLMHAPDFLLSFLVIV
jgi:hypothetical protein